MQGIPCTIRFRHDRFPPVLFAASKLTAMMCRPALYGGQWRGKSREDTETMAHVLIVTDDIDVRTVLEIHLRGAGHAVLTSPASDQALAVLRVSQHPLVVLLHSSLTASESIALLQMDGAGAASHLARHRYVVLGSMPHAMQPAQQDLFTRLRADVLALPFDLAELEAAIEDAEHELDPRVTLAASSGAEDHA